MTAPSNAATRISATTSSTTPVSKVHIFLWTVRRELWEYRSVYLAPLIVGGMVFLGFAISLVNLPEKVRAIAPSNSMDLQVIVQRPFLLAALLLMLVDLVVAALYCLDSLYGERRDRSILFWKSLPISDFMSVLAKASIPILVLPFVTFAVTVATQIAMLLVGSIVFVAHGMSSSLLWAQVPVLQTAGINLYHMVVYHGLWYAPFYAWLLLASAWSKRTPLLWAILPALAIGILEKVALNTSYFATMLLERFAGTSPSSGTSKEMTMAMLAPHPGHFLFNPALWIGLILATVFLVAAARIRRQRGVL